MLHRSVGDPLGQAFALSALGALALYRKEFDGANSLLEQALALTDGTDDPEVAASMAASTVSNMAGTAYAGGDLARAAELADDALERYRRLGYIRGVIGSLRLSAHIARDRDDDALALQRYQETLGLAHLHDDQHQMLVLLESIARIAATKGKPALAARLFAAAVTLRERTGTACGNRQSPTPPSRTRLSRVPPWGGRRSRQPGPRAVTCRPIRRSPKRWPSCCPQVNLASRPTRSDAAIIVGYGGTGETARGTRRR